MGDRVSERERVSEKDKLDADEQRKYSATVVVGGDGLPLLFLLLLFLASVTEDILFAGIYKRERGACFANCMWFFSDLKSITTDFSSLLFQAYVQQQQQWRKK